VTHRSRTAWVVIRRAASVTSSALTAGTLTVSVLSAYLAVLTGAARSKGARGSSPEHPKAASARSFVILVPAHNEEPVIHRMLKSFRNLDYPPDQFAVHVVADNCTDGTADVVRDWGYTAHVRTDPASPGKGPALNWLYDRLVEDGTPFESVLIIDADTTVHPDFLKHIAAALDNGSHVAQAYYAVHDADGSSAAALRSAALACRHHLRPLGRTAIGASSGLYGNGMAFDRAVMDGRRWSGHLIEDAEFQMELLLDGERVAYVPDAILEAEMPHTLDSATSQNQRWELGRLQLARRYVPKLVRRLRRGPANLRMAYADAILDHLTPPLSVLVALDVCCVVGASGLAATRRNRIDRLNLAASLLSAGVIVIHVISGLRSVNAPRSTYRALMKAPKLVVWKMVLWCRVIVRPGSVTWKRTTRNVETP
jgi:cellulose synthase/poly-beta-1,6-N-acetylglucosamine synthase-like glycosyltransferase